MFLCNFLLLIWLLRFGGCRPVLVQWVELFPFCFVFGCKVCIRDNTTVFTRQTGQVLFSILKSIKYCWCWCFVYLSFDYTLRIQLIDSYQLFKNVCGAVKGATIHSQRTKSLFWSAKLRTILQIIEFSSFESMCSPRKDKFLMEYGQQ